MAAMVTEPIRDRDYKQLLLQIDYLHPRRHGSIWTPASWGEFLTPDAFEDSHREHHTRLGRPARAATKIDRSFEEQARRMTPAK